MAGIEEEALLMVLGPFEKPFDPILDVGGSRPIVQEDADVIGLKPELLEDGADEVDVVDAAFESIGWIGVIVDANQERTLTRSLASFACATVGKTVR